MGIFGDGGSTHELMRKPVSLDEILEEEKRIIELDRASKDAIKKHATKCKGRSRSHSSRNPYDAHAAPSYTPDPDPPIEEPTPVAPRWRPAAIPPRTLPTLPATPIDELEAAALAAYYTTLSRGMQDRRTHRGSDGPYSSSSEYGSRRRHGSSHRSYDDGSRRPEHGLERMSSSSKVYPYRTGAENEIPSSRNQRPLTPPPRPRPSIPSARAPQFLPQRLSRSAPDIDNDDEVVCLGERVAGNVPPPPKMKPNIPILIVDDDEVDTVSMMDT